MYESRLVYIGLLLVFTGIVLILLPARFRSIQTRPRGAMTFAAGLLIVIGGLALPAREKRVEEAVTHLDELMPRWQFSEHHTTQIAASPERVYQAIREVRADEIALFHVLTWIRRGGRNAPESILNAGSSRPLLDVATNSGFIYLADDPLHELVIGTVVVAPRSTSGPHRTVTPDVFRRQLPPGFAIAAMNFLVRPNGRGGSFVSTDTRVYANDDSSRRRFAMYWRVIYPGSSLIRVMWLRAIKKRAEG